MISPNVLRAVGESFEAHKITVKPGEKMAEAVARTLKISPEEANRWLEALDAGCSVEEANRWISIASHTSEPWLTTLARKVGAALGTVVSS